MKNISAVVFLISGVINSIGADRTLPEILTEIIRNSDQSVRDALVQELMMDTDDHNDKANEGFQYFLLIRVIVYYTMYRCVLVQCVFLTMDL